MKRVFFLFLLNIVISCKQVKQPKHLFSYNITLEKLDSVKFINSLDSISYSEGYKDFYKSFLAFPNTKVYLTNTSDDTIWFNSIDYNCYFINNKSTRPYPYSKHKSPKIFCSKRLLYSFKLLPNNSKECFAFIPKQFENFDSLFVEIEYSKDSLFNSVLVDTFSYLVKSNQYLLQ